MNYPDWTNKKIEVSKPTHRTRIEMLMAGLRKHIESSRYQGTRNPQELLKKMEAKILTLDK